MKNLTKDELTEIAFSIMDIIEETSGIKLPESQEAYTVGQLVDFLGNCEED